MIMITQQQKKEIQWQLQKYIATFPSQKQAAASLADCSEATVINIYSGKWDAIGEKMWISIAKQLGIGTRTSVPVETLDFNTLILYYSLAKEEGATFAMVGPAGSGKTFAGKWFAANHRGNNVYYLECAEYWNKKMFLGNLLQAMGRENTGASIGEMMEMIVRELRRQHQPLIILDEVDKLSDSVLSFFITLYNDLNNMCGFVWTSTNAIEKRMTRGRNINKRGYQELFSRIGSKFIALKGASPAEIREICEQNGITDPIQVGRIINDCEGDLRRVSRHLLKEKAKQLNLNRKNRAS